MSYCNTADTLKRSPLFYFLETVENTRFLLQPRQETHCLAQHRLFLEYPSKCSIHELAVIEIARSDSRALSVEVTFDVWRLTFKYFDLTILDFIVIQRSIIILALDLQRTNLVDGSSVVLFDLFRFFSREDCQELKLSKNSCYRHSTGLFSH